MFVNDIILVAAEILFSVLLFLLAGFSEKRVSPRWRICYAVPFLFCIYLVGTGGFEPLMLGAYIASVIMLYGLFRDNKKLKRIFCTVGGVCTAASIPLCIFVSGYRTSPYVKDFNKAFNVMREYYVLTDHKNIDFDALYQEYLPKFKDAEKNNSKTENALAWTAFCAEFYDGHVGYISDECDKETLMSEFCGNDYGLSTVKLSDGRYAAVSIEENSVAAQNGIHNGTIITKWDGCDLDTVAQNLELSEYIAFPDKSNEEFFKSVFAAGKGGENVDISFLDDSGNEKTITVPKTGNYYDRGKDVIKTLNKGIEAANMSWTEVDEKTAALRIKAMMYDFKSYASNKTSDFDGMKNEIRSKLIEYRELGYENLIIDLRENSGGSGMMVMALASLIAPEGTYYYCSDGVWDDKKSCYLKDDETGRYIAGAEHYFDGENIWGDNPIIILVNMYSISAADHLVKTTEGMKNVTVMGLTKTNGSAQGIFSVNTSVGTLCFSGSLLLDKNGDILIDSGADHISGNRLDVQLPLDEEAIKAMFDNNEDYVLSCALEYFDKLK